MQTKDKLIGTFGNTSKNKSISKEIKSILLCLNNENYVVSHLSTNVASCYESVTNYLYTLSIVFGLYGEEYYKVIDKSIVFYNGSKINILASIE